MYRATYSIFSIALFLGITSGVLLMAGCSQNQTPENPGPSAERMGGPGGPGGPGGRGPGGPGGGRFAPVAATATATEIFPKKCAGCHGDKGEGKMGPNLTKLAGDSDDELYKTIHDGKGKMPAFGKQMTEAQIKQLVAYVKGLGSA